MAVRIVDAAEQVASADARTSLCFLPFVICGVKRQVISKSEPELRSRNSSMQAMGPGRVSCIYSLMHVTRPDPADFSRVMLYETKPF